MKPGRGRHRRQRGAALAYVLALLAVVGMLVGQAWRLIRSDNAIAALERGDAQARLMALAGVEYALAKIGPPGPSQNLRYAAEGLRYRLDDSGLAFDLTVRTRGLFARARSTGATDLPRPGRTRAYAALIGQALDLGKWPALGLLNHEGNLVLAGTAQVTGPILLWRGDVRKATDYNVRWTGGSGHAGALWDSASAAWKAVPVDFGRAVAWMESQGRMLAAGDFSGDGDYDSGMVRDLVLADTAVLTDTVLTDARIVAAQMLRVGRGVRMSDCKLVSRRIVIEGDAVLERTLAFAARTIDIRGGRIEGGQFLAMDSLRIDSDGPLRGFPVFYAQGGMAKRGTADSAMVGALSLERAAGEGVFLSACHEHPSDDQEARLSVGPRARITGLLYTPCHARMEGVLQGSLVCHSFTFEYKGTIWGGHLKDARIEAMAGRKMIPAPMLFPGSPPAALAGTAP